MILNGYGVWRSKGQVPLPFHRNNFTEIKRGFCLFYTTFLTKADKLRAFHPICTYWEIKLTEKQKKI